MGMWTHAIYVWHATDQRILPGKFPVEMVLASSL